MRNRLDAHPAPGGPHLQHHSISGQCFKTRVRYRLFRKNFVKVNLRQPLPDLRRRQHCVGQAQQNNQAESAAFYPSVSVFCLLYAYLQQLCVEMIAGAAVAVVLSFPDCAKKFSAARFL